jgi:hypothetical protein
MMEASVPKKRGRKPKSESTTSSMAHASPSVRRRGKLNIVAVDDDKHDEHAEEHAHKEHDAHNAQPRDVDNTLETEPISSTPCILTLDPEGLGETRCSLERRPACDNRPGYFPLLQDFGEVYPSKTDILCWWCCHSFPTHPIGIPMRYDANLDVFKVVGCFCSLNCAYAYSRKENMGILPCDFRFMYEKIKSPSTQNDVAHEFILHPAPERYLLKKFGGCMSIEEYRASFFNSYEIMYTPMMPFGMLCDEVLGRSLSKGWTKDGIRRPLEIRRAKKDLVQTEPIPMEKKLNTRTKQRTTVTQMISFEDNGNYAERWA